ncbi:MAG: FkbM family methyltransferase [Albidovulum sp.]
MAGTGYSNIPARVSPEVHEILQNLRVFRQLPDTSIISTEIDGQRMIFTVADRDDRIQKKHWRGKFYEPDELAEIARHFPKGGVFCDVGANVGNHTLFALKYLGAAKSIVFEPNPVAYRLLVSNILLNGVADRCDLSHLGLGIAEDSGQGFGLALRDGNLGAARLIEGEGSIEMASGDACLADQKVDFMKIDVEGMEMDVLKGFKAVIRRDRPVIFLELEKVNEKDFATWALAEDYSITEEVRSFAHNRNVVARPS